MLYVKTVYREDHSGRFIPAESLPGDYLPHVLREAQELSRKMEIGVMFLFNEIELWVTAASDLAQLQEDYETAYYATKETQNHDRTQ